MMHMRMNLCVQYIMEKVTVETKIKTATVGYENQGKGEKEKNFFW